MAARIVKEKKIELTYCPGTDLQSVLGKDLMSVLIKSNMLNPKSQSMSDDEIESRKLSFRFGSRRSSLTPA